MIPLNDDIVRMSKDIVADAIDTNLIPSFRQKELEFLINRHAESVIEKEQTRFKTLFRKILKRGVLL